MVIPDFNAYSSFISSLKVRYLYVYILYVSYHDYLLLLLYTLLTFLSLFFRFLQLLIAEFSNLKMLGHVYMVEDAKDLAKIVRDVTRYGDVIRYRGAYYRPEVCTSHGNLKKKNRFSFFIIILFLFYVYEFIQRRSYLRKIEKIVDKMTYSLSIKEDCIIS